MSSLADLLAKPSVESWKAIVEIGKKARKILRESEGEDPGWQAFMRMVRTDVQDWPPRSSGSAPRDGQGSSKKPSNIGCARRTPTATTSPKSAGIPTSACQTVPQAVWLERRFTGGVVPVSTAQSALRLLTAALAAL